MKPFEAHGKQDMEAMVTLGLMNLEAMFNDE